MRRTLPVMLTLMLLPTVLGAQEDPVRRILPNVRYFKGPVADPLEPRLSVGLLHTNLFVDAAAGRERERPLDIMDPEDSRKDVDAVTAIGGTLPWWHAKSWGGKGGIVVAAQAGVFGRFRIEYPTREDVGQDWFVGMPIEFAYNKWSGRFRFMHRSSHVGDELVESTGVQRVEVGGEYVDVMAAYEVLLGTRVYGSISWIFRPYTENAPVLFNIGRRDRTLVQLGADARVHPWMNGHFGVTGGVDWRRAERTDWQDSFAAAAGLSLETNNRSARLLVRYFSGASLLEQFFLSRENYWSIELITDF